jgi:hypothetical protein
MELMISTQTPQFVDFLPLTKKLLSKLRLETGPHDDHHAEFAVIDQSQSSSSGGRSFRPPSIVLEHF